MPRPLQFTRIRGIFRISLSAALCLLGGMTPGCANDSDPRTEISSEEAPSPLPLPVLREGLDVPLDMRLARLLPSRYVDTERTCHLEVVGQVTDVKLGAQRLYPTPVATRSTVRCGAATGGGWADLVYSVESAPLATSVLRGRRIRVRIAAGSGGFDDYPILEFLALLGEGPLPSPRGGALMTVPSGFDFGSLKRNDDALGSTKACAVSHVGLPELIPESSREGYPRGSTHRMRLSCRHAEGDAWLEVVFEPGTLLGSLRAIRGRVIPVRLESATGGIGGLPLASYVSG